MFNVTELVKRIVKYLIEGLMVAIAAFAIPKKSLNLEEVIILALSAAATFSILDVFVPSISESTKNGLGMGLGLNMIGGLRIVLRRCRRQRRDVRLWYHAAAEQDRILQAQLNTKLVGVVQGDFHQQSLNGDLLRRRVEIDD